MRPFYFAIFVTLSICLSSLQVWADGGNGSGGGVGFLCEKRVYLADTYDVITGNQAKLKKRLELLDTKSSDEILKILMKRLQIYLKQKGQADVFTKIASAQGHLKFKDVDTVEATDDHHISPNQIPQNCQIVQLARQSETGPDTSLVELSGYFTSLSPVEQALLIMHEIRLRYLIEKKAFYGDTTPVRGWVDQFAKMSPSEFLRISTISVEVACSRHTKVVCPFPYPFSLDPPADANSY